MPPVADAVEARHAVVVTAPIGRRELLVAVGGAAAAWPFAARAAGPRPRIAVLSINSEQDEGKNIAAFVDGLRALGYVTSQNVDIDYRYAEGDTMRLKPLAQELLAFKPDVAFANSPSPAGAPPEPRRRTSSWFRLAGAGRCRPASHGWMRRRLTSG